MPTPPFDHPVNLQMQTLLTVVSWGATVALAAVAIHKGRRERTPFFLLLLLAGWIGGLFEPIYDTAFMLLFYVPGQWTLFTAFNVPQPVWVSSAYVTLFAGTSMFIADRIHHGLTRAGLFKWAAFEFTMTATFEIVAINGGAYEYWGPHALRLLEYPLAIGALETAQVIWVALAAAELRRRSRGVLPLFGLLPLFPCVFLGVNIGAGAPLILALHLETHVPALVAGMSLVSIGLAILAVRTAAGLLPTNARPGTNTRTLAGGVFDTHYA